MESWPRIPDDVLAWFRSIFAAANRRVCERLVNLPNVRETSLDDGHPASGVAAQQAT